MEPVLQGVSTNLIGLSVEVNGAIKLLLPLFLVAASIVISRNVLAQGLEFLVDGGLADRLNPQLGARLLRWRHDRFMGQAERSFRAQRRQRRPVNPVVNRLLGGK